MNFPKLFTQRLLLRELRESDWKEILFLRSDPSVNQFISRPPHRQTNDAKQAFEFIERINGEKNTQEWFYWCINLKGSEKTIGSICLWNFNETSKKAELGYDLHPDFQGKGIMSEALISVVDFGFNILDKDQIEAFTHQDNIGSIRLLERNGFQWNTQRKDEENEKNLIFELRK